MESESSAAFTLTGQGLDPDQVTVAAGIAPSVTWRTGDLVHPKATARYQHNGWNVRSSLGPAADLESMSRPSLISSRPVGRLWRGYPAIRTRRSPARSTATVGIAPRSTSQRTRSPALPAYTRRWTSTCMSCRPEHLPPSLDQKQAHEVRGSRTLLKRHRRGMLSNLERDANHAGHSESASFRPRRSNGMQRSAPLNNRGPEQGLGNTRRLRPSVDTAQLPSGLVYVPDSPTHGTIQPGQMMENSTYQELPASTRDLGVRVDPPSP